MIRTTLRGLVAATALLVASAGAAEAQAQSERFGVKAGLSLPMGDFGDAVGLGIHAGAHVSFPLSGALGLRLDGDFGTYGGEDNTGVDRVNLLGGVANLVYRMNTRSELKPYFLGGLGLYNWTVKTAGGDADETDLAFNVGVGYDFTLGGKSLFTELRYLSIQSEGSATNMLPIVIGLRF